MASFSNHPVESSRSIYYSLTDDGLPDLTEEERSKLEIVMQKAMEFEKEENERIRQPYEGQLFKYVNVMKGWQYRWFIILPDCGRLEYYLSPITLADRCKARPRGSINLVGASVSLSDEDSLSFSVTALCGEVYKLKAVDSKERHVWVEKIKSVIQLCNTEFTSETKNNCASTSVQSPFALCKPAASQSSVSSLEKSGTPTLSSLPKKYDVSEIKAAVNKALQCQKALVNSIESLPHTGSFLKCSDNKLLLIKAISQGSVQSIEKSYHVLRCLQQREIILSTPNSDEATPSHFLTTNKNSIASK